MFSSVLPQLHTFRIRASIWYRRSSHDLCSEFGSVVMPKMSNLKQLVVDLSDVSCNQDLLPLIDLIRGSPRLRTFVIEEPYQKDRVDNVVEVEPIEIPLATSTDRMILRAYPHFKEVKFVGYRGVRMHFELLKHLVENAIALETIVIDPWGVKERNRSILIHLIAFLDANLTLKYLQGLTHLKTVPFGINVKIL